MSVHTSSAFTSLLASKSLNKEGKRKKIRKRLVLRFYLTKIEEKNVSRSERTYLLFPMSMMTMLELECCLASSNHVVRCSNVSRLGTHTKYSNTFVQLFTNGTDSKHEVTMC